MALFPLFQKEDFQGRTAYKGKGLYLCRINNGIKAGKNTSYMITYYHKILPIR